MRELVQLTLKIGFLQISKRCGYFMKVKVYVVRARQVYALSTDRAAVMQILRGL